MHVHLVGPDCGTWPPLAAEEAGGERGRSAVSVVESQRGVSWEPAVFACCVITVKTVPLEMLRLLRQSSICTFFPRVAAMFALKALFVEGNRNPLVLTQKEVLIFLLSEEIFMGSTRTFEEPGFMEEKVILEARQL